MKKKAHKKKVQIWINKEDLEYQKELRVLQIELLKMQKHVKGKGLKVLVLFEGRDAAGKGGTIKRVMEHLNPRGARVVALEKPNDKEQGQWYFQRYISHLPSAGELVFFDRSWYNRAGVEPVMGFCTPKEHEQFLSQVSEFEKMLVSSEIVLMKFYVSVSKEVQAKRFKKRELDPLKQYKLSPVDKKSQTLWNEYTKAKYSMLRASHTSFAPWIVLRSDDKQRARLECIKCILDNMLYKNKIKKLKFNKNIVSFGENEIKLLEEEIKMLKGVDEIK